MSYWPCGTRDGGPLGSGPRYPVLLLLRVPGWAALHLQRTARCWLSPVSHRAACRGRWGPPRGTAGGDGMTAPPWTHRPVNG